MKNCMDGNWVDDLILAHGFRGFSLSWWGGYEQFTHDRKEGERGWGAERKEKRRRRRKREGKKNHF